MTRAFFESRRAFAILTRFGGPALLFGVAACGREYFEIDVVIPPRYSTETRTVRLEALDPPASLPFSCEDLAYGFVEPEIVSLSLDRGLGADIGSETTLGRFARPGLRVFMAEASDGKRVLLQGCVDVERLDPGARLEIALEPIVAVEPVEDPMLSGVVGGSRISPVRLSVKDVFGEPAVGVHALWATEARGTSAPGESVSNEQGSVEIDVATPDRPGPLAVDVRVRWATERPFRSSGFLRGVSIERDLQQRDLVDAVAGRFGMNGEGGIALLMQADAGGTGPTTFLRLCTGAMLSCDREIRIPTQDAGRLVVVPSPAPQPDRLLLIFGDGWFELQAELTRRGDGVGAIPIAAELHGPCDRNDLVLVEIPSGYGVYSLEGRPMAERALEGIDARIVASGCVDMLAGGRARTHVFRTEAGDTFLVAFHETGAIYVDWNVIGPGIAIGLHGAGPLLGTQLDFNEFAISRAALNVIQGDSDIEIVATDLPPAFPIRITGGDLDGDRILDVAAILAEYDPEMDQDRFSLWAALDDAPSGERIAGHVGLRDLGLCSDDGPLLWLIDLDGDDDDDVVLVDHGPSCGSTRVIALPM